MHLQYPSSRSRYSVVPIPTYHSWYPCYSSQAVLRKHSLVPPQFFATSLIHGYHFTPRYVVTLSLSLSASFNQAHTFGPSSCCPTNPATPPPSFQSPKLSSCSYSVAVHLLRRRPLYLRHESQHPNLTGVRPLERAYCHELHYISYGLNP
jgi:hypothetical protein